jgi:Ca2+-dependent lipid-binding protein
VCSEEEKKKTLIVHLGKFHVNRKQDLIGKGDPYVTVRFNGETQKMEVVNNTQDPVFDTGVCMDV